MILTNNKKYCFTFCGPNGNTETATVVYVASEVVISKGKAETFLIYRKEGQRVESTLNVSYIRHIVDQGLAMDCF